MQILHRYNKRQWTQLILIVSAVILLLPLLASANEIGAFIYRITTGLGSAVLWLCGGIFDYVVVKLVVEMGLMIGDGTAVGGVIVSLWELVRDVFNLLFIFGVIYIGFRVILFSEDSNVHKTLGWLIVAALMINFSLFITKAIVDVSNATSYQLYVSMVSDELVTVEQPDAGNNTDTRTIAATFMNLIKLTTYMSDQAPNMVIGADTTITRDAFFGFLMMFIMLIAAFVFAAGAFMFFARFVALVLFMIVSPVMFVGMIFPFFQQYQKMWWNAFLRYSFVAPAYLFMIYISIQILTEIVVDANSDDFAAAFASGSWITGKFIIFMYFFLVAGFLIASLYVANKIGVYGAGASMKMVENVGNGIQSRAKVMAGGATFGLAARLGRNTVGYGAQRIADNDNFQRRMANLGYAGEIASQSVAKVADSSFDARRVGGLGKSTGIGEGRKGGYTSILKETAKNREKIAESFGTESEAVIAAATVNELKAKQDAEAAVQEEKKKMEGRMSPIRTEITRLQEESMTASEDRKKEIAIQISAQRAAIETIKEEHAPDIADLEGKLKVAEADLLEAETRAKYKRQNDYIDKLENRSVSFVDFRILPTGGSVNVQPHPAASYNMANDVKSLKKKYGNYGEKMMKREKRKENYKIQQEAQKDDGVEPEKSDNTSS